MVANKFISYLYLIFLSSLEFQKTILEISLFRKRSRNILFIIPYFLSAIHGLDFCVFSFDFVSLGSLVSKYIAWQGSLVGITKIKKLTFHPPPTAVPQKTYVCPETVELPNTFPVITAWTTFCDQQVVW